jgi:hypothetical protein
MLFLTRMFGVTGSDAERDLDAEADCIEAIVERVLLLQSRIAAQQYRPLVGGTHVKGTSARGQFKVYEARTRYGPRTATRLAKGIFATPGVYPARVRFANADSKANSDFKADVRSLSFSVDLSGNDTVLDASPRRCEFSLQNSTTLPINDARALLAMLNCMTAWNPVAGLWSLPLKDKLRVLRAFVLRQVQAHQKIKPYQQLRYGSNVPFRHGPIDVVKYLAKPIPTNPAHALQRGNPNALQDELLRHLREDTVMSSFDFALQFLDADQMTYWGKRRDAEFWTENASVEWKQRETQFHTVARLTLLSNSQLPQDDDEAIHLDITGNARSDSAPLGSINRVRQQVEVAGRRATERVGRRAMRDPCGVVETFGKSGAPAE